MGTGNCKNGAGNLQKTGTKTPKAMQEAVCFNGQHISPTEDAGSL